METEPRSYGEFWLGYLRTHTKWQTRSVHYIGVGIVISSFALATITGQWWLLALGIVINYAGDWSAHFFIEQNRPSAFDHPIWSMASGFRMFALWTVGRLRPELERAGIESTCVKQSA